MTHPDIVIAPTRKARPWLSNDERAGLGGDLFDQMRSELTAALLTDPQTMVWTPGFGKNNQRSTATAVFFDDLAGQGADAREHAVVRLIADAAKGEDVQLRAMSMLAELAKRHAEFHNDDAVARREGVAP